MKNVIGLFGTCGGSQWRNSFMDTYKEMGIDFFNPDAGDNWHPGMVEDENKNLREDNLILFPVLAETGGQGSLGEIGFSILNVIRNITNGSEQTLIILIDDDCTVDDSAEAKSSVRTRKLVKSKVKEITHPNVFLVETLEEMLDLSLQLQKMYELKDNINQQFRLRAVG